MKRILAYVLILGFPLLFVSCEEVEELKPEGWLEADFEAVAFYQTRQSLEEEEELARDSCENFNLLSACERLEVLEIQLDSLNSEEDEIEAARDAQRSNVPPTHKPGEPDECIPAPNFEGCNIPLNTLKPLLIFTREDALPNVDIRLLDLEGEIVAISDPDVPLSVVMLNEEVAIANWTLVQEDFSGAAQLIIENPENPRSTRIVVDLNL